MQALERLLLEKQQELISRYEDSKSNQKYWRDKVDELYQTIQTWLAPLEAKQLLKCHINEVPLGPVYESESGQLEIEGGVEKSLVIQFFNDEKIEVENIGIEVLGAFGRLYMKMELEKMIIELDEKGGKWFLVKKDASVRNAKVEFNNKSFEDVITEFVKDF